MEELETRGYHLVEVDSSLWLLLSGDLTLRRGSFLQVATYMVASKGFKYEQLDEAITAMTRKGHNAAHFGMYKDFMYSVEMEFGNVKKVS